MPNIKYVQPAAPGEMFAPDAFASQIGKTLPLSLEGDPTERDCKLVGATVSEDGTSVELTLEVDDLPAPQTLAANGISLAENN
jgi:hypothetical protein